MNSHEFKHFLAPLFKRLGYRAKVTKGSGDFGADLILSKRVKKYDIYKRRGITDTTSRK
ncbi:restriction endonuclease [Margalitia sp. FSL K6-0131]|uniref:restriction endonuclease n=1 Tax=Margalitia sp. FSL K6-0131 TaxID=2954604 RepID=UPI004046AAA1